MGRLLIIDDDPRIRQVIRYTLVGEGHQVEEAADGQIALDRLAGSTHPDVILLDMKMPGMDGWQFMERYRARYGRRAQIIVVTAARDAAGRSAAVEADGYLAKPFDLDELIDVVDAAVQRVKPAANPPPGRCPPPGRSPR